MKFNLLLHRFVSAFSPCANQGGNAGDKDPEKTGGNHSQANEACLKIAQSIMNGDALDVDFLNKTVPGRQSPPFLTRKRAFEHHIQALETEFRGHPRVLHVHASLIVAIRRQVNLEWSLSEYRRLWENHAETLLGKLSLRWLVSAADTFADYPRSDVERSIALTVSLFVNTIKLAETERHIEGAAKQIVPSNSTRGVMLFDGLTAFRIKKGDMVTNLFNRIEPVYDLAFPCGRILKESVSRIKRGPTTYSRLAKLRRLKTDINI